MENLKVAIARQCYEPNKLKLTPSWDTICLLIVLDKKHVKYQRFFRFLFTGEELIFSYSCTKPFNILYSIICYCIFVILIINRQLQYVPVDQHWSKIAIFRRNKLKIVLCQSMRSIPNTTTRCLMNKMTMTLLVQWMLRVLQS